MVWSAKSNQIPTLIISGSESVIRQDKLQEVSELIPDCQFVSIEGAGHHVHKDNLSTFVSIIKEFMRS